MLLPVIWTVVYCHRRYTERRRRTGHFIGTVRNASKDVGAPDAAALLLTNREHLRSFIEQHGERLFGSIRVYVSKTDLCRPQDIPEVAEEILSEVVVEAFRHADRFDPTRSAHAWLLGFAANVIKRRLEKKGIRYKHERTVSDLRGRGFPEESDEDFFDRVTAVVTSAAIDNAEATAQAEAMFTLVSDDDATVIRLGVLHDFSGQELAQALGIMPSAARVRLSRALKRLRQRWYGQTQGGQGDA